MRGILASVDEHTGTTLSSSNRSLFFPLAFPSPPHPIVTNWPRESRGRGQVVTGQTRSEGRFVLTDQDLGRRSGSVLRSRLHRPLINTRCN